MLTNYVTPPTLMFWLQLCTQNSSKRPFRSNMGPTFQFHIYSISTEGPKIHLEASKNEQRVFLDQT